MRAAVILALAGASVAFPAGNFEARHWHHHGQGGRPMPTGAGGYSPHPTGGVYSHPNGDMPYKPYGPKIPVDPATGKPGMGEPKDWDEMDDGDDKFDDDKDNDKDKDNRNWNININARGLDINYNLAPRQGTVAAATEPEASGVMPSLPSSTSTASDPNFSDEPFPGDDPSSVDPSTDIPGVVSSSPATNGTLPVTSPSTTDPSLDGTTDTTDPTTSMPADSDLPVDGPTDPASGTPTQSEPPTQSKAAPPPKETTPGPGFIHITGSEGPNEDKKFLGIF